MAKQHCSVGDDLHLEERVWLSCLPFLYLDHKQHHKRCLGFDLGGLRVSSYLADFEHLDTLIKLEMTLTSIELHGIIFVGVNLSRHVRDKP
jgi:hypothetical protein